MPPIPNTYLPFLPPLRSIPSGQGGLPPELSTFDIYGQETRTPLSQPPDIPYPELPPLFPPSPAATPQVGDRRQVGTTPLGQPIWEHPDGSYTQGEYGAPFDPWKEAEVGRREHARNLTGALEGMKQRTLSELGPAPSAEALKLTHR